METNKETAKKTLSVEYMDDIEITKKHVIIIPKEDWDKIFECVNDILDEDYDCESTYSKGISTNFDGDLTWINFDWLIEYLENRITDLENYNEEEDILPIINKYKGYIYQYETNKN